MASPPRPSRLYLDVGAASWPFVKVVLRHGEAAVLETERLAQAPRELDRKVV